MCIRDRILSYLRTVNTNETFKIPKQKEILADLYDEADYYRLGELKDLLTQFPASEILNRTQINELINLIGFDKFDQWKLLYRATQHGFKSKDFHSKCDGSSKTLTIVRTTNGYVFGGYTEAQWDSSGSYKYDAKAFIFSLVNREHTPVKINVRNENFAIFCDYNLGPTFGYLYNYRDTYHDFAIADESNLNEDSFTQLGFSYNFNLVKSETFLAGSKYFRVENIEVFKRVL